MDKKTIIPTVTIALLSCIALMLTVIGGLYTYNTFVSDAQPVSAQGNGGTDKGPSWSVTPVTTGGDKQLLVIVREVDNPYDSGNQAMQMAVYEMQGNNARGSLYLVATRLIEYDLQIPYLNDERTAGKSWTPDKVKEAVDAAKAAQQGRKNSRGGEKEGD